MIKKLVLGIATLLLFMGGLFIGGASAQTGLDVGYAWAAPDSGNAVEFYSVEMSVRKGLFMHVADVDTNYFEFFASVDSSYAIRVTAVDIQGGESIVSEASDLLVLDFGPPSQPGKPFRVQ